MIEPPNAQRLQKRAMLQEHQWKDIKVPQKVKVYSHKHHLTDRGIANNGWNCNKLQGVKQCYSGLNGFHQSDGLRSWECRECDYDLCEKCMQVEMACD